MQTAADKIADDAQFAPGQHIVRYSINGPGGYACFAQCNLDSDFRLSGKNFKSLFSQLLQHCPTITVQAYLSNIRK